MAEDGHFDIDLSTTTRDHFAAVQELKTRTKVIGEGKLAVTERHTTLKLSNKREALVDLGRAIGVFKEDPTAGQPVAFIIQNLYVNGEPANGRSQSQAGSAEEFLDPALAAPHVR